jgi:hypothetical protein
MAASTWLALRGKRGGLRILSAAEKRALKAVLEAELARRASGASYEGSKLWQRRNDRWLERSAASSES